MGMMTSWKLSLSHAMTLALIVVLCLGMTSNLSMALEQVETKIEESEPRDMTTENLHSIHIQYCVS